MSASSVPYDNPAIVTFAKELEAWRCAAKLNKKELADLLGYTDSYVGQIELRKNTPSEDFARDLDTFFVTNGVFHRLWERIIDSRSAVTLPPGFLQYVEREKEAVSARVFCLALITGLFQTEGYAHAMISSAEKHIADQLVAKRMERQSIVLREESPAMIMFTVDETALRRVIGSREVQREQIQALLEASERPNVVINVVPQDSGYHPGLTESFTILGFGDGSHATYTESFGMGVLLEDPVLIAKFAIEYDVIRSHVLPVGHRDLL
ncbi:helix-turn-helix domain-containing protein [Spirillospora sp. CA-253888]